MAYNKAKAEREWRLWKEAEEKQMRRLGVDEETVAKIREYDWAVFNSNRRFYQRISDTTTYKEAEFDGEPPLELQTADEFLDSIENEALYIVLKKVDKLTIQIVLWRLNGYQYKDISQQTGLTITAIKNRVWYFRKKLKKYLELSNL